MSLGIAHDKTGYLIGFLAVLDLQENCAACIGHIKHPEAAASRLFLGFITNTGCAEKAFELVAKVLGGPKAIEIALLALNFSYKVDLAFPE